MTKAAVNSFLSPQAEEGAQPVREKLRGAEVVHRHVMLIGAELEEFSHASHKVWLAQPQRLSSCDLHLLYQLQFPKEK